MNLTDPQRGRVYRRCGCRDVAGRQYGTRCPKLNADLGHGSWAYAVDLPSTTGKRETRRRSGFSDQSAALTALQNFLLAERTGIAVDEALTVADYLREWLLSKQEILKATTYAGYERHVRHDLIPAFGPLPLADLRDRHVTTWSRRQLAAGRGRPTVHRCCSILSSAMNAAVSADLLARNPARNAAMKRPAAPERLCWTPQQASAFLHHNAETYNDVYADIFEVILGTGMRRGEVLGLHWPDIHFQRRVLFVRWTLASVNNARLHLQAPKTRASRNWVSLSPRVTAALRRQAARRRSTHPDQPRLQGMVFTRPDGKPINPERLLHTLRQRSAEIGLPKIGLHDLRHTAATIMISSQVPLAVVSKTLRHSTLATTVNIYGHLLPQAAREAVTALADALDHADLPRKIN
ncbi:tyrosine-type recombinase/integrase [Kitasatospora aureofaciens]|uniref:Site-specific integrase n=1 Tax=Kitasatospora aureofaciens TaxID=1894 RepID=A0A8H9I1X3_KITAU|nr:site-specific integrase [Kitasatospora aureofaciens]ARF78061.1 site-specific integrase [Kitasatospora aureofaciens]GGV05550.1 site-specific integrase [Kitasatospora aureofaciens]